MKGPFKQEKGSVLLIQSFRMSKKKDKKNKNVVFKENEHIGGINKDMGTYHHCDNKEHQKRNDKEYLATVKTMKLNEASPLDMFIIENHFTTLHCSSWALDTKYGFHICNCMKKLKYKIS